MPEQFRIDGTFRDSAAVHSNILSMLPRAVLMNNLRKHLLTYSTFAGNQDRQIGRCDLQSHINRPVQPNAVTDDSNRCFIC